MKNNLCRFFLSLCVATLAVACCDNTSLTETSAPAKHVVLIGLDGLAGNLVEAAEMPTLKDMMAHGAWTLKSRSVLPSSSAVNWASTYMGVPTEMHGYHTWGSRVPDFPSIEVGENGIVPTIFTAIHRADSEARTSAFYEWEVHGCLIDSIAVSHHRHVPMRDGLSDDLTAAYVAELKQNKPIFSIVIYDSPDVEGHEYGWGSPEYMARLKVLDNHIAQIVEATKESGTYEDTLFIVMADHGGINKGHGGTTAEEMDAPLIFCGSGVKQGFHIESAVMRFDTAPTIAYALGIEQPDVWRGKALTQIFE